MAKTNLDKKGRYQDNAFVYGSGERGINQILILFVCNFSGFPRYPYQAVPESALVAAGVPEEEPVPKAGARAVLNR